MTVAGDYRKLAQRYRTLPEQMVRAGAAVMQQAILEQLKRDIGPDRKMSGFTRRRGVRHQPLGVSVKVSPGTRISTATVAASPPRFAGMWTIIEAGTAERIVGRLPRKDKSIGPGGKHMKLGDEWLTGPWSAGRSPAKHTFTNGVRWGTPDAERAIEAVWNRETGF